MAVMKKRFNHAKANAFTLVELMVVLAIVSVLAALGFGLCSSMRAKGAMIREVAAGRTLGTAYLSAAADNEGRYLAGMDYSVSSVDGPDGSKLVSGHTAQRYPYRLAPWFEYRLEGVILLGENATQISGLAKEGTATYQYLVSAFPAFGINYHYVGGLVGTNGETQSPEECLTRQANADRSPLLFATASVRDSLGNGVDGFNLLTPPNTQVRNWVEAEWESGAPAGNYGNVDARHDGKAVCVFLDGSVRLHAIEELRDMRLWSRNAAHLDDRDYLASY
jgi:prepilin-type N-terminal cleavage/methylation domain-containing protein/prepilin-type processing-associated H-X9-DG protein